MNPAERVPFGRTGLSVTRLGLGTAPLGGLFQPVSDEEAEAVIERAWQLGLRLFDTAPLYGSGLSEQRLGRVLRTKPRGEFVLSTKVGRLLRPDVPPDETQLFEGEPYYKGTPPLNPVFDFSYHGVLQSLRESLARLGLERVDIALIHDPDRHYEEALHGAYPALDHLRTEGQVRAVGAGMNQAEMPAALARAASFDCFLLAGRYTLLDQSGMRDLLPLCLEKGIAIMAGGVYNSGILADPQPGATYDYTPAPPQLIARAQRLDAVCRRFGVPLKAAAIQFPLGHPAVACVLTGARSVSELDENIAMFRHPIPSGLWEALKEEALLLENAPVP